MSIYFKGPRDGHAVCFAEKRRLWADKPEVNRDLVFYMNDEGNLVQKVFDLFKDIWPMEILQIPPEKGLGKGWWKITLKELTCYQELCVVGNLFHTINENLAAAQYMYTGAEDEKEVMKRLQNWPHDGGKNPWGPNYAHYVNTNHISLHYLKKERKSFQEMRDHFLKNRTGGFYGESTYSTFGWAA